MNWKEAQVAHEPSIVIHVEDTGLETRVGSVWVRRNASTPLGFEGHTPTTRICRVTNLSPQEIRAAIETEWGG